MVCICSDYAAQTQSPVLKKAPGGIEDEPRVILIPALTLVYKYWEIQSKGRGWHPLFHTAFHLLINRWALSADCALNSGSLGKEANKPNQTQPNLLPTNGMGMDRWPEGAEKERLIEAREKEGGRKRKEQGGWCGRRIERVLSERALVGFRWNAPGKWLLCDTKHALLSLYAHTYTHTPAST